MIPQCSTSCNLHPRKPLSGVHFKILGDLIPDDASWPETAACGPVKAPDSFDFNSSRMLPRQHCHADPYVTLKAEIHPLSGPDRGNTAPMHRVRLVSKHKP